MTTSTEFARSEFDLPLRISTRERCDICAQFRDRIEGREEFESIGMWGGPWIETAESETIAEGHESVRLILDGVLEDDVEAPDTCRRFGCSDEATHTIEIEQSEEWVTSYACQDCADTDRSSVEAVYEGVSTNPCNGDRCYNLVHESRDYCLSHQHER